MTYEERVKLYESISEMPRRKLIDEHMKAVCRLDTLSEICDVDDTYRAIIEQTKAQEKNERLKAKIEILVEQVRYAKRYMLQSLRRRRVECDKKQTLPQLIDLMVESDKKERLTNKKEELC